MTITKTHSNIKLTVNPTKGQSINGTYYTSGAKSTSADWIIDLSELPLGASLLNVTTTASLYAPSGGSGYATIVSDGTYQTFNNANMQNVLEAGTRQFTVRFSFTYPAGSTYYSSVSGTWQNISLVIEYAGEEHTVIYYGLENGWQKCYAYVEHNGEWVEAKVTYGDNGAWQQLKTDYTN